MVLVAPALLGFTCTRLWVVGRWDHAPFLEKLTCYTGPKVGIVFLRLPSAFTVILALIFVAAVVWPLVETIILAATLTAALARALMDKIGVKNDRLNKLTYKVRIFPQIKFG